MRRMLTEQIFHKEGGAMDALAGYLADRLDQFTAHGAACVFAVGGGRTPAKVLPALSKYPCHWERVTVTLTDDRCVPIDDPDSNEAMVRRSLLQNAAAKAKFVGLLGETPRTVLAPDLVYLGFGEDGHVASIFPGGPECDAAGFGLVPARAPAHPVDRVGFTLPSLIAAREIVILVSGADKGALYAECLNDTRNRNLPLAMVLRHPDARIMVLVDGAQGSTGAA